MENIRLIIWDLDETFWKGTLSEGSIEIPDLHIHIIKKLTDRGIINSICSKNDMEMVKKILEEKNIWQYFVFPMISWGPKGPAIKEIVSSIKLRPESILFIDDNPSNREEVKYFVPQINVSDPDIIHTLLENNHFQGKNDENHSRLQQYKILEKKQEEEKIYNSNEEFLKQSNICVEIHCYNILEHIDRIHELNQRTNQLNFTKKRLSKEELISLIQSKNHETAYISVKDKYGDYGIVGFYAIKNNKLEQFYFSCRILGLGVEQWIYAKLNFPQIDVLENVATKLTKNICPEWIKSKTSEVQSSIQGHKMDSNILLIGGCDLEQTAFYLEQMGIKFDTQFNYLVGEKFDCHPDSSIIIRQSIELSEEQKTFILSKCKFYDKNTFINKISQNKYDVIFYSPLIDMAIGLWHYKNDKNIKVVYGNRDGETLSYISKSKNELNDFYSSFVFEGGITPQILYDNLIWIRNNIDSQVKLIILNAGEDNIKHPHEHDRYKVHIELNKVIEEFCKKNNNTYLLDIKTLLKRDNDYTDNIRHYTREIYYSISIMFVDLLTSLRVIEPINSTQNINKAKLSPRVEFKKLLRELRLLDLGYKINNMVNKKKN